MTESANPARATTRGLTRTIFRWIHLIFSIPILGYIYSPSIDCQTMPLRRAIFSFQS